MTVELDKMIETFVQMKDPFAEGQAAARSHYATWFDCPYTGDDYASAYDRTQWLNGFSSIVRTR